MNIKYTKNININFYKVVTFFLIIATFMMRPTALGQKLSSISLCISILTLIIYILLGNNSHRFFIKNNNKNATLFCSIIFWFYCGIQSLIMNSSNIEFSLKAIIINLAILIVFYIILSCDIINYYFFKTLIIILALFSISYYITFIFSFIVGLDKIHIFNINIEGYPTSGLVYFPFTIEYNKTLVNGVTVIRALTFFREAGIAQMFYLWGIFISGIYFNKKKIIKLILFLGMISCFSTTGFIIFIIVYLINIFLNINKYKLKSVIAMAVIVIFTFIFMNTNGISIKDKALESITDRTYAITQGINLLVENPLFGIGYYNGDTGTNMGINFISSLYMIGLVGGILYLSIFIVTFIKTTNKKVFILSILPILITLLFTQPLIDSPLIYIMLLANYDINIKSKIKEKFIEPEIRGKEVVNICL